MSDDNVDHDSSGRLGVGVPNYTGVSAHLGTQIRYVLYEFLLDVDQEGPSP